MIDQAKILHKDLYISQVDPDKGAEDLIPDQANAFETELVNDENGKSNYRIALLF